MTPNEIEIRCYSNRKLYISAGERTSHSAHYVSFSDLMREVKAGYRLKFMNWKTFTDRGSDVSQKMLTSMITTLQKKALLQKTPEELNELLKAMA